MSSVSAGSTSNPKPIGKKSQTLAQTSTPIMKPADLTSALAAIPSTSKSTTQSVHFKANNEASTSNPKPIEKKTQTSTPIIKPADLTDALAAVQGETTQSTSQNTTQSGDFSADVPTDVSLRRLSLGLSMEAKEVTIKHESEVDVHSTYDQNSKRIQEIFNQIGSNDPNTPPDTTSEAQAKADQEDDCEMINSDGPFPLPMLANTDGFIKFENDTISGNFPFIMTVSLVVLIDRLFVHIF